MRPIARVLLDRLREKRRFIQVLIGPRQTGKTTIARQILSRVTIPSQYASADEPGLRDRTWIEQQWEIARTKGNPGSPEAQVSIFVLDEVQKVPGWSETVKRLWDEDSAGDVQLHVVILGSSQLLMQQGLTESLAGRFEIIPVPHWSFVAIEVKSGRKKTSLPGIEAFSKGFPVQKKLLVGKGGISLKEFLGSPVERWLA